MANNDIENALARIRQLADKPLFFIVGMPRSGTTWLQRMLDRHVNICCRGEAHFVDIFFANIRKAFQEYNKSVRLQGGSIAHLREYGGHVDKLEYSNDDMNLILIHGIYLMFDKWVDSAEIKILGEKTPDNILSMNLLANLFPQVRFVHVVRDGRDAAVSGWFFNNSGVDSNKVISQSFQSYVQAYLKQWRTGIQYAQSIGSTLGERYFETTYELLVENPYDQLTSILRFLDTDFEADTLVDCIETQRFYVLAKGRKNGSEDSTAFFRKGVTGDWRNHFDAAMTEQAWRLAGDKLEALGYQQD